MRAHLNCILWSTKYLKLNSPLDLDKVSIETSICRICKKQGGTVHCTILGYKDIFILVVRIFFITCVH